MKVMYLTFTVFYKFKNENFLYEETHFPPQFLKKYAHEYSLFNVV